jgi:hypothetical protein
MTAAAVGSGAFKLYKVIAEIKECLFILRVAVKILLRKYWKN